MGGIYECCFQPFREALKRSDSGLLAKLPGIISNLDANGCCHRHLPGGLISGGEGGLLAQCHAFDPCIVIETSSTSVPYTALWVFTESTVSEVRLRPMPRALDTSSLPKALATALWPWIDIVEAAKAGMGDRVRMTAENTVVLLRREIEVSSPLETAMEDALLASDTLAQDLDRVTFFQTDARTEALLALNALVAWLQTARPSVRDTASRLFK